jgi:hypothetical protein
MNRLAHSAIFILLAGASGCNSSVSVTTTTTGGATGEASTMTGSTTNAPLGSSGGGSGTTGGSTASGNTFPRDGGVLTLFSGHSPLFGIAVDANHLYWTDGTNIMEFTLSPGSQSNVLATGQYGATLLRVNSDTIYWSATNKIVSQPRSAGVVTTNVVIDSLGINSFALGLAGLFWSNGYSVKGQPLLDGSASPVTLASGDNLRPGKLTFWNDRLFWADPLNERVVSQAIADGGTSLGTLATNTDASAIALDDTFLYWTETYDGSLSRIRLDGTGTREVLMGGGGEVQFCIGSLAVDALYVYWADACHGAIGRTPLAGTGPRTSETLVSGLGDPVYLVIDDSWVYWTDQTEGSVGAIPK